MGVELELQLVNQRSYNLTPSAAEMLSQLVPATLKSQISLEMTQGMIEVNSSVHSSVTSLIEELRELRSALTRSARLLGIALTGGGTHPFQQWSEQRITPSNRFSRLYERYGYLAKAFTVFGQHIHIGVASREDALYLMHALSRYVPHFIALSAASPFYQGVDTKFSSSRSTIVRAFPLSGTAPVHATWNEFEKYCNVLLAAGIITSTKDFYWDVRIKPEYGTVEIRVCDTPLTIEIAAYLGLYAQLLARWLLEKRPYKIHKDFYLVYQYNRFEASRFGLKGFLIPPPLAPSTPLTDVQKREVLAKPTQKLKICQDILAQLKLLEEYVGGKTEQEALQALRYAAASCVSHASWLRSAFAKSGSLNDTVRFASELWQAELAGRA